MKKIYRILLVIFILLIVSPAANKINAQVAVKAIGVGGGWYIPSMDFWNEDTFVKNWSNQFEGGIYGNGYMEVQLVRNVSTRVGLGYWSQEQSQESIPWGNETRTDNLKLTLIPVTMDIIAYLELDDIKPVNLYGGIGWGINFIKVEYTRTPTVSAATIDDNTGQDYLGYVLGGIDIPVTTGFAAAVEFRYVFGEYGQQFYGSNNTVYNNEVSLSGPQISLVLKYMLSQ